MRFFCGVLDANLLSPRRCPTLTGGPRRGCPCAVVVDMLVHTPGPTGVEVGREGWRVGCDDHPIPCSSHPSHLFEVRNRPFKPLRTIQPIATSDGNDKTTGRCTISSFGSIYPTPRSRRRSRVRVWEGLTRSMIGTARALGMRSGAAPPPPSDDGGMAPPRSFFAFSFPVYIISSFVFHVYTAHHFASLSLLSLTTLLP